MIRRTWKVRLLLTIGAGLLAGAVVATGVSANAATAVPTWVDSWAASPQSSALASTTPPTYTNQTLRLIVRSHSGGTSVRVRLANTFGDRDLTFGHVTVASRSTGAAVTSVRTAKFAGLTSVTVLKGAEVSSDPVSLTVAAGHDLAVSIYLPKSTGPVTYHRSAHQTSYVSGSGDHATETGSGSFGTTIGTWPFLDAVSVGGGTAPGTIVALGDSITDGSGSTTNTNRRWPDKLSARLRARTSVPAKSVVDEGIAGNQVLTDSTGIGGPSVLHRLTRDVLVRRGLTDVILLEGINDLRSSNPPATADQIIAGYQQIIDRVHGKGARIFGGTLTPVEGSARYTSTMEQQRQKLNAWIKAPGHFDGFVDFATATADPADPLRFLPTYDSGDHLHPNDAGYQAMANAVNLSLFDR
jgi:lysophospholipase L1-like esterase